MKPSTLFFSLTLLGLALLIQVLLETWKAYAALKHHADHFPGFHLRRSSLSPQEWSRWNTEFLGLWKFPALLAVAEGVLFSVLLKKTALLLSLVGWLVVGQMLPMLGLYVINLGLLYRYGRFNLERFDEKQELRRQLTRLLWIGCLWMPFPSTLLFLWGRGW